MEEDKNNEKLYSSDVQSALMKWSDYLQKEFKLKNLDKVEQIISPLSRDRAWMYHGGSGNRSLFYLIDDCVQLRFDFDLHDTLISCAVFPKTEAWLKAPDGTLLKGGETYESDILFV